MCLLVFFGLKIYYICVVVSGTFLKLVQVIFESRLQVCFFADIPGEPVEQRVSSATVLPVQ